MSIYQYRNFRAAEKGLLTSVSAMVTFGDSCHDAILDLQKKHGSQIGIGLHLSITAGMPVYKPLSAVSSLCDQRDGSKFFRSFRELELTKIKPEEVYKELEAQVELMGAILGGIDKVDHIDVHVSAQEILAQQGIALACGEARRLAPHTHGTDGFFAAVLERAV